MYYKRRSGLTEIVVTSRGAHSTLDNAQLRDRAPHNNSPPLLGVASQYCHVSHYQEKASWIIGVDVGGRRVANSIISSGADAEDHTHTHTNGAIRMLYRRLARTHGTARCRLNHHQSSPDLP